MTRLDSFLLLLLAAFAWLVSRRQALVVGAAVTGLFLLAATFSAAHHLAFAHSPAHPNGFFANTTWHGKKRGCWPIAAG